ncbi:MAG: electron transfer flavoprotein subunit beta/FixA family protein [Deltaproteobacteria bacterium]|nr:MAG: electron transfer flavoprotein subunit beta/FixA family protein [Deltaproteobacteria bacterium]
MNIIVCIKEVADPEAPADEFKLDPDKNILVSSPKVLKVVNPFDEQAVEAALRIRDKREAKVTILSLGLGIDRVVAKKPLHMGADELILLEDEAFADGDSWSTAYALASAIRKIGDYDLVLCGRQSADSNAGQIGPGIAEFLGLPSVGIARKIEIIDGKAKVERVTTNGYEIVDVVLPALITVSNELGPARYPSIQNIRKSEKIQPIIWKRPDLGLDPSAVGGQGRRLKLLKLFQPVFEATCEMVEGETPEEAGENLALRLRGEKIL